MSKRGFTLIELMIVVSIMGLVMAGLSQIIKLSSQSYSLNIELNDAMARIKPMIKRIERRSVESNESNYISPEILDVYKDGTSFSGIKIDVPFDIGEGADDIYWYWWDSNSKNFYRSTDTSGSTADPSLGDGKLDIPIFRSRNSDWEDGTVSLKRFEYEFYEIDNDDKIQILSTITSASAIDYIRMKIELEGELADFGKPTKVKFSTGFTVH